jgi:crotonobetainyl-CoA:carnitine CoA-transferase CaiB-like acyl-CoA transferase
VSTTVEPPLSGLRIVDLVRGPLAPITRYLAELGAQVDRIDTQAPATGDLADFAANAGKRRWFGALDAPFARELIAAADAVVADVDQPLDLLALRLTRPGLVTMTVSPFGAATSVAHWQATGPVLHALSGELSRSGIRGKPPLLPPGDLAHQCAAAQGAFVLAAALYRALSTGAGDHLDFSALEGAMQALDPGFGISGSATMGKPAHLLSRDRPQKGFQYPILRCADGYVRICLLAKRQWQGMFRWMGEPAAFASPDFEKMAVRYKSPDLLPAIAAFFAGRSRRELEAEGQRFGVPISAVLTFEEFLASDHLAARQALRELALPDGDPVRLPNGAMTIDGERMAAGEGAPSAPWPPRPEGVRAPGTRCFAGLKVLDLGVIVVGAELGRLLADQGADVVKVESRAYPDGNRQSYLTYGMSVSFAAGQRNRRSLGLNLRDPDGKALFLELAARADVILSNFKPGTLEALGLSYAEIAAVNPRVITADSSAFGASGPWSGRMGYGPLVRAATGLTLAWRYPDEADSFSDSVTVYPDHVAGRVGALAVTALLIRRLRTGRGGAASVAQSEVMLTQFAEDVARLSRGRATSSPPDWPWSVYPSQGDDEWCVVTVRDGRDWAALCAVIGFDGAALDTPRKRLEAKAAIDRAVAAWTQARPPIAGAEALQAAGVPAAPMLRVADLPQFASFRQRGFFRIEDHPYLREQVIAERWHVKAAEQGEALQTPAPLAGEHSAAVIEHWLRPPAGRTEALIASGALEPLDPEVLAQVAEAMGETASRPIDLN